VGVDETGITLLIGAGAFGLILGSFLNVVIFRLPRECMSIVRPRSRCVTCLRWIPWTENIPVLSWLALRGRCRGCGVRISARYPLVELLTGGLVLLVAWMRLTDPSVPDPFDRWVLIACTFIDFEFRILPDPLTYAGIVGGVIGSAAFPALHRGADGWVFDVILFSPHVASLVAASLGAVFGAGVILFVRVVGSWIFRKEAMGQGDVFYMAFIGAFVGWRGVLGTFVIACFAGSVYGIAHWLITRDRYLAFGPFLSLGALVMMLFPEAVFGLLAWYQGLFR
jgi:leader peptidase (prepilin peptidase)/N-methyltransferase